MGFKKLASMIVAAGLAVSSVFCALPVNAAGAYFSELTGEPTDAALINQRPIAVMTDNDRRSLPHYNAADADIVYELVNSLANNRITRLMCVYKNWTGLSYTGSIRSTRPTNIMLADELNAVLVHDGGPFYNDAYFAATGLNHLSGGFPRVRNGKAMEFTEYITGAKVASRMAAAGYSTGYQFNPGNHFNFTPYGTNVDLNTTYPGAIPANTVTLPFANTSSTLVYNALTGTYDYYEFGSKEKDASGRSMTFKNVFIQDVDIHQYDANGYLVYNCIGTGVGFYLTNGYAVPVIWLKPSYIGRTIYLDATGKEIVVNNGKSYITMVPSDTWTGVGIR